jgi:hypothetical protein
MSQTQNRKRERHEFLSHLETVSLKFPRYIDQNGENGTHTARGGGGGHAGVFCADKCTEKKK